MRRLSNSGQTLRQDEELSQYFRLNILDMFTFIHFFLVIWLQQFFSFFLNKPLFNQAGHSGTNWYLQGRPGNLGKGGFT